MEYTTISGAGYYLISLTTLSGARIVTSNNERAFVISQLQDLLGRRSLLEDPDTRHRLSSHIDLLAFSILDTDIQFVAFSISSISIRVFAESIADRLREYQSEWRLKETLYTTTLTKLIGPHDALTQTVQLHLRHTDWEYDRYSSVGFYLHDRRGDWMHTWRVGQVYENNPERYRELLTRHHTAEDTTTELLTTQPFASLSHA